MSYFPPYVDQTGYHYPTYNDVLAYLVEGAKNIFGQDIYLGSDSQDYQLLSIFAKAAFDSYAAAEAAYNAHSPVTSVGTGLDAVVAVNGIARKEATRSVAQVTLTGEAGTTVSGGVIADSSGTLWDLPAAVVLGEGGAATVTATCRRYGQVVAGKDTITRIMTPTLGWTAVTNDKPATPGRVAETDAQLRARQALSTAQPSASMMEGLDGALRALPEVTRAKIYENDTDTTDANGVPPHSVCCVVEGGKSGEIAETIFNRKPIGCGTHGGVTETVLDAYGGENAVKFQRPQNVDFDVTITLKPLSGYDAQATPAAIAGGVTAYLDSLGIGDGLTASMLWWAAMNTMTAQSAPTFSITSVTCCRHGGTPGTADIALGFAEVARGNANYVTVAEASA